jgi:hypothetical protein
MHTHPMSPAAQDTAGNVDASQLTNQACLLDAWQAVTTADAVAAC